MGNEVFYVELGQKIRQARKARGLNQAQLGQMLSLSRTSITNIERGRQRILCHLLVEISNAVGVEARHLLPSRPKHSSELVEALPEYLSAKEKRWIEELVRTTPEESPNAGSA